ncbi:MAG: chemotaxis protein CheW [Candidatus Acidiferrales bacterium]|jgi:purine-binding chemotaxis protein CheW
MSENGVAANVRQLCTFFLEGRAFGVPVEEVREVIRHQMTARVPLAPAVVSGLINLRGQIVTAIDLRRRFGMADRAPGELPVNVIVRTEDMAVSLLVDQIGDVVEVSDEAFETPPETLPEIDRHAVTGLYKLPDRLLILLDVEKVVDLSSFNAAAAGIGSS